jgi:DNA-binding NarL/FixJ family response regulator
MKIRLLLIDDFPLVREGIAAALATDPAFEIVGQAGDGRTGLELARELRPDVVLLDLQMPDMGGIMVLDALREQVPGTRVLVLTASENPESLLAAIGAGATGYLTKQTNRAELCSAVVTVHGGGSVIAPSLAGHLVHSYAKAARGDADALQSALSPREHEVLRLVAMGLTDIQIAETIFVSPRTVQNHLARIRDKAGVRRRGALTRWAVEHGIC